jgi:fructose-bisphosphate aldolase class I
MDGRHDIDLCFAVTQNVLTQLFIELNDQRVDLRGLILKPNMVVPGNESTRQVSAEAVAKATVTCLLSTVPRTVPGIAFLSGGQSPETATEHLNAMHVLYGDILPWALTFSFSRAIQDPELHYWKGKEENIQGAQHILYERMLLSSLARKGEYKPVMEGLV